MEFNRVEKTTDINYNLKVDADDRREAEMDVMDDEQSPHSPETRGLKVIAKWKESRNAE